MNPAMMIMSMILKTIVVCHTTCQTVGTCSTVLCNLAQVKSLDTPKINGTACLAKLVLTASIAEHLIINKVVNTSRPCLHKPVYKTSAVSITDDMLNLSASSAQSSHLQAYMPVKH